MTEDIGNAAKDTAVAPPPLQPPGLHVPPLPSPPSLVLPATLRTLPWITDAATDYIDSVIALKRVAGESIVAMECGSGSSTGYLAQRVTRLVSFDHDGNWHAAIRTAITAIGCANVEWRTAERPYARFFGDYADETFDIVLVDGRDRTACVELARRVLKPGGVLAVDNTERISGLDGRGPYFDMLRHLDGWQAVHFEQPWKDRAGWTPPHRWVTSVWRKPGPTGKEVYTTLGLPL
jgi:SAM-dependent methyltransferase